jgi:hypothetical protein
MPIKGVCIQCKYSHRSPRFGFQSLMVIADADLVLKLGLTRPYRCPMAQERLNPAREHTNTIQD